MCLTGNQHCSGGGEWEGQGTHRGAATAVAQAGHGAGQRFGQTAVAAGWRRVHCPQLADCSLTGRLEEDRRLLKLWLSCEFTMQRIDCQMRPINTNYVSDTLGNTLL